MRYLIFAVGLVAASATAQDAASPWQIAQSSDQPDATLVAFVKADNGNQFAFKCDKPGSHSVYAMFQTSDRVGSTSPIPSIGPVSYRFDDKATQKDNWRYYEHLAVALNSPREQPLVKFLQRMGDSKKMEFRVDPLDGPPITTMFDVTGSADAIAKVFDSCKDKNPVK